MRGKIRSVGLTDTGRVREHNEDTIAFDADIGLLVLADGMGGYNAGEVASGIAVKTIVNLVREAVEREDLTRARPRDRHVARPSIILRDAIHRANKIIYQTARTQPQCEGMGTTVVAALFFDNRVSIAHVGDSRLYRLRSDTLRAGHDGSLAAAGAGRPRLLLRRRSAAGRQQELRHTRAGRRAQRRGRGAGAPGRRRATSTCCARTGCPTWSKTKTFI